MNRMRVKTKRIISKEEVLVSLKFKFICVYISDGAFFPHNPLLS